jgi:hypothetical protein
MDSERSGGLRHVPLTVREDTLNVFPFYTRERLGHGDGSRTLRRGALERDKNLIGVDRLGQIADRP